MKSYIAIYLWFTILYLTHGFITLSLNTRDLKIQFVKTSNQKSFHLCQVSRGRRVIVQFSQTLRQQLFGILRSSILRIDLAIRLKGGRNHFFRPKLGPKVMFRKPLFVES